MLLLSWLSARTATLLTFKPIGWFDWDVPSSLIWSFTNSARGLVVVPDTGRASRMNWDPDWLASVIILQCGLAEAALIGLDEEALLCAINLGERQAARVNRQVGLRL